MSLLLRKTLLGSRDSAWISLSHGRLCTALPKHPLYWEWDPTATSQSQAGWFSELSALGGPLSPCERHQPSFGGSREQGILLWLTEKGSSWWRPSKALHPPGLQTNSLLLWFNSSWQLGMCSLLLTPSQVGWERESKGEKGKKLVGWDKNSLTGWLRKIN